MACRAYAGMHPGVELAQTDIRKMSFRHLRGQIALVAGGPPCQPFSSGGKRLAASDPRDCVPEFLRVVKEVQPEAFLMENVGGLVTGQRRVYFEGLIRDLASLGFQTTWSIVNAADYGVPQKRRRLFILGTRLGHFAFPAPSHGASSKRPWRASGTIIRVDKPMGEPNPSIVTYAKNPDLRPSPYDGHLFNGGGRPIDLDAPAPTILASAGGNKTPFVDVLGLVPGYHAELLRGMTPREGIVEGARRITVAEAAALQTFPKHAKFAGPRSSQYTLVGNAVPPRLAQAVSEPLLELLCRDQLRDAA
jgi:DNA (cytosine-5)-methyltransferase 1